MNITVILTIIFIHWIADFVLQREKWSLGKSKNWGDLLAHTVTYSLVWLFIGGCIYLQQFKPYNPESNKIMNIYWNYWIPRGLLFVLITFVCHTITDYFTSRLNSRLLPKTTLVTLNTRYLGGGGNEMLCYPKGSSHHNFFVSIGFDQVLHYTQLFLTYYFLTK